MNKNRLNYIVYWMCVQKVLKNFCLMTWCTKKPFGYRVVHHMILQSIKINV